MDEIDIFIIAGQTVVVFLMVLNLIPILIWMERKGAAYIQDRRGPNRAEILGIRLGGILHSLADAIKLLTKEEVLVGSAYRPLALIAPILALFVASVTVAVVPFTEPLRLGGYSFVLQVADLNSGLIYVFAISSLGVYALMLAGWSSGTKFTLLGAMRAASQTISYELSMGMSALAIFILVGSFSLSDIVADQGALPWHWNIVRQPLAFVMFFASQLAEMNRLPFDLPEGESEIVAGYHTEYSSMRFAMFFMGEYAHIIAGSAILATLFFGGWQFPCMSSSLLQEEFASVVAILWPGTALFLMIAGGWLTQRFRRRYHDRRDFETIIFGVPMMIAGLAALLFFVLYGSAPIPEGLPEIAIFVIQMTTMLVKTIILCAVFIWIRWTLPRFRYDQLMRFGWKMLLPLSMINVAATAMVVMLWK